MATGARPWRGGQGQAGVSGAEPYSLHDGGDVAVIGGGPAGSFFSIFALKFAALIDAPLNVTIFDPKDFSSPGPGGCNRCGGVISELLLQTLAVEGINLPDGVVQRGINSYRLHTAKGTVSIATPLLESSIATVYRGGGPRGCIDQDKESFDQFLLDQAVREGAVHERAVIDRVDFRDGRPRLFSADREVCRADLVVGAFGVNGRTPQWDCDGHFTYAEPETVTTAIAEVALDRDLVAERFGNAIQLFLLPIKNVKFAAMIPKGTYVTICLLGREFTNQTVKAFLEHPVVREVLPDGAAQGVSCRCLPKMNVRAPTTGYADRMVMCGDAGSTRLFKDGLGAAYLMGKAAAVTALFHGVGMEHFRRHYAPVYRSIVVDNWYGQYLFAATDVCKKYGVLTDAMLAVVRMEQARNRHAKTFSTILWNMFTGNERYKNILFSALSLPMHLEVWLAAAKALLRRRS